MKKSCAIIVSVLLALPTLAAEKKESVEPCSSVKEYITTLEFLRDSKTLRKDEKQARDIADQVSKGCNGAASRFIRVARLLEKTGLPAGESLKYGKDLALKDDSTAQAFMTIYQNAFVKEFFDLDHPTALKIASNLSLDFKADPELAVRDFHALSEFCVSEKGLSLPKAQCAELAARITRLAEKSQKEVAPSFFEVFNFAQTSDGPNLSTSEALKIAEDVVKVHPNAAQNFIQAYKYASDSKGLDLKRDQAVEFAKQMAGRTLPAAEKTTKN